MVSQTREREAAETQRRHNSTSREPPHTEAAVLSIYALGDLFSRGGRQGSKGVGFGAEKVGNTKRGEGGDRQKPKQKVREGRAATAPFLLQRLGVSGPDRQEYRMRLVQWVVPGLIRARQAKHKRLA